MNTIYLVPDRGGCTCHFWSWRDAKVCEMHIKLTGWEKKQ